MKKVAWFLDFNRVEFIWKATLLILNCASFWKYLEFWKKQPWQQCRPAFNFQARKQLRLGLTLRGKQDIAQWLRAWEHSAKWPWASYLASQPHFCKRGKLRHGVLWKLSELTNIRKFCTIPDIL